jgi:hypothetical protein
MNSKTIQRLVNELCTLPGSDVLAYEPNPSHEFAMAKALRDSLGRALEKFCIDEKTAIAVKERLMLASFRPTPGDIARTAQEFRQDAENAEKGPPGCGACGNMNWVCGDHGAERCKCARGRWLLARDRENAAKRDAGLPL